MGTWGVGITANDEFEDIKGQFFDCYYYETMPISEIENLVIATAKEYISDQNSGEWHNVYFAIAWCEWRCGYRSPDLWQKVEDIIAGGKDIAYWRELGATPQLCRQREKVLQKFLAQIKTEQKKSVKRQHKKRFIMPLKTGDVFACYSKANGYYGCGVALRVYESRLQPWEEEFHFYALFAISALTPAELPTAEQVLKANVKDIFWNGGCIGYDLPKKGIIVLGNVADQIHVAYDEFRGDFFRGKRHPLAAYLRLSGRPPFDKLISREKECSIMKNLPFPDQPMTFFFDERNI